MQQAATTNNLKPIYSTAATLKIVDMSGICMGGIGMGGIGMGGIGIGMIGAEAA